MAEQSPGRVTSLLRDYHRGEPGTLSELLDVVHPELRRIARCLMHRERTFHTLQPTGLVHEAFFRLFKGEAIPFESRQEFFAAAVRHMRRTLIDHARRNLAEKRQHPADYLPVSGVPPEQLLDLNRALDELALQAPDAAQVVELKYYGGLSVEEIAAVLEVSPRNVVRTWTWARTWLFQKLAGVNGRRIALPE